ncbi:hypothetical protein H2200_007822 [Cladophialophora chaetospira]|uniref:Short-chain dehydrogenase n=1 Tax=Cladophialophora chaetospira TaxID=386627 RepID=A0AA38X6M9_9EURO|nr:hypothetical protein H2200_007822 [Cladophialophora chaetospira]
MVEFSFETTGDEVVSAFPDQVKGKIFMITGPSWESIGAETVLALAKGSPGMVILLGRDISKIQPVIDEVGKISPLTTTKFFQVHLDSLASVREAAKQILDDRDIPPIDFLINNAGIMACPYEKTKDDIERQFATNHIGHFLLTNLIMPKLLVASPNARVVNVSSYGNVLSNVLDDPNFNGDGKDYSPFISYGQSKTANVLFSVGLNERLGSKGLKAFALCPGSVPSNLRRFVTPEIMKEGVAFISGKTTMPPRKTIQQGCSTTVRAAIDPSLSAEGSIFLSDTQVTLNSKVIAPYSLDKENAERCWKLSEDLVGQSFSY